MNTKRGQDMKNTLIVSRDFVTALFFYQRWIFTSQATLGFPFGLSKMKRCINNIRKKACSAL